MQPLMHLGQLLVLEEAVLVHVHCFGLRQKTRGIDHRGLALLELGTLSSPLPLLQPKGLEVAPSHLARRPPAHARRHQSPRTSRLLLKSSRTMDPALHFQRGLSPQRCNSRPATRDRAQDRRTAGVSCFRGRKKTTKKELVPVGLAETPDD